MWSTFGTCKQTNSCVILFINKLNRDGFYCADGMAFIIEQCVFHIFIILDRPLLEFFNPQIFNIQLLSNENFIMQKKNDDLQ